MWENLYFLQCATIFLYFKFYTYCHIFAFFICPGQDTPLYFVAPNLASFFANDINFSIAITYTFTVASTFTYDCATPYYCTAA